MKIGTKTVVANKSNIKKYAKELLGVEYTIELERRLIDICTKDSWQNYHEGRDHISFAIFKWMSKINRALCNFGVESIDLTGFIEDIPQFSNDRYVIYSNTGDSYATTILWYGGKLRIGSTGSLMEGLLL